MSQNRTIRENTSPGKLNSFLQTYVVGFICGNAALFVGHPAERLKVAAQVKLNMSTLQVVKPLITNLELLYTGFVSCIYRQNIKLVYRSAIMSQIPHRIDDLNLSPALASALKASFASSIDTAFVTPPENVKTWQMRDTTKNVSVCDAISGIYQTRGFKGFLFGVTPTMTKSFPAWFYLFLGYHATKEKRQKENFFATIFWATCASIPVTVMTNPIDVIKTNMQATKNIKSLSMLEMSKNIYQQHGLFAFGRGLPFRLIHKALATSTAYFIMDADSQLRKGSQRNK